MTAICVRRLLRLRRLWGWRRSWRAGCSGRRTAWHLKRGQPSSAPRAQDRRRPAVLTRENRKDKTGREEAGSQNGGGLGQGIAGAATSHEDANDAAHAEGASFGALPAHGSAQAR